MIAALYSKDRQSKNEFIKSFIQQANGDSVIYVYPKNRKKECPVLDGVFSVTYEDVTKRDEWLHINSIISPNSVLVLENPSRYPKISSQKFGHLKRLSMQLEHKALVDIVPFTLDVQYLYTPLAYLDRAILGYAHYYAFRENYYEKDDDGVVRSAHDFDVLAKKMKLTCDIDYDSFLCRNRELIEVEATTDEHCRYQAKREELFSKEKSPQRIITRLADTVHAFESRLNILLDLLSSLQGRTVVYCNLGTYAKRVQQAIKSAKIKGVQVTSYQTGHSKSADNCVYYESPIVKSYFLLDAESRLPEYCNVYHFLGDTKVDQYLYGLIDHEIGQINALTQELYHETRL